MRPLKKPQQIRSYKLEDPSTRGVERGRLLFQGLTKAGVDLGERLLDVGCGFGGLSIAYAKMGKTSFALDANPHNIEVVKSRLRSEGPEPGHVFPFSSSALRIPLAASSVDLALMIGVVEWLGYSDPSRRVPDIQVAALKEVCRVIRPGGALVVGTKNRLFPRYFWSDAQLKKPVLNLLPRPGANWLSTRLYGYEYRGYVYSYWGWKRLFRKAGLLVAQPLVPIFTYQYPLMLAKPWHGEKMNGTISSALQDLPEDVQSSAVRSPFPAGRAAYYRLLSALHLLGLGAGCFLFVCKKPG